MSEPLVSVIIPCYNQAHLLPVALASVQAQTAQGWECIVVNDGSPDNTAEVAKSWVQKDSRFRYIEKPNGGLSSARNAGIDASRGRFLQFLDADDVLRPRKLELQLAEASLAAGTVVVYCDYSCSSDQDLKAEVAGRHVSPKLNDADPLLDMASGWETKLSIPCHCFLFDARLFSEGKMRFDEGLPNHEDWDCWMRIFACKPTLRYVDVKLAIYRIGSNSMCSNRAGMRKGFLAAIRKQQRLLRRNRVLVRALKTKRREIERVYADCKLSSKIWALVVAVPKRVLPRQCWDKLRELKRSLN